MVKRINNKGYTSEQLLEAMLFTVIAVVLIAIFAYMLISSERSDAEWYDGLKGIVMLPNGETVQGDVSYYQTLTGSNVQVTINGQEYIVDTDNIVVWRDN